MRADNIPKPEFLYFEDDKGNRLDVDIMQGMPEFPKGLEWRQRSYEVVINENVCQDHRNPKFPIRLLKWLYNISPYNWKGRPNYYTARIHSGLDYNSFPIVKYLVDKRGFRLSEALKVIADLCPRCECLIMSEIDKNSHVYAKQDWCCKYCDVIDPGRSDYLKVRAAYITFWNEGDIVEAYKMGWPNNPNAIGVSPNKDPWYKKIIYWFKWLYGEWKYVT